MSGDGRGDGRKPEPNADMNRLLRAARDDRQRAARERVFGRPQAPEPEDADGGADGRSTASYDEVEEPEDGARQ
jgi:hypothetical protein